MNIRSKVLGACESFLRVPPLLIVDEIFRISFGFGGKIIEYGVKNIVTTISPTNNNNNSSSDNSIISNFSNSNDSYDQSQQISSSSLYSSSIVNPFISYISNSCSNSNYITGSALTDEASAAAALLSSTSGHSTATSSNPNGDVILNSMSTFKSLWGAILGPATVSGVENAGSILGNLNNQSEYLLHLNFGDLTAVREGTTWELLRLGEVIGCLIVFFAALIMFLLSTENLLKLYSYLVSILTIYLAYVMAPIPFYWESEAFISLCYNIFFRTGLVVIFFFTRCWPGGPQNPQYENPNLSSLFDSLIFSLFYVCGVVRLQPVIYLALVLILQNSLWACAPKVCSFLKDSWKETRRVQNEYGLSHLIQVECGRLKVNTVFRLFWISRAAYDAFFRCCDDSLSAVFRYVMSHGTETFTGIVGLTVTVSVICHSIGEFLLWLLYLGTNSETDANRFGSISTVLFFILSLQTGLTSLDPEKRLDRLLKNVVLLATALFHALHQMVAPLLHAFRTFQGLQVRAVSISVAFLSISIISTLYLLRFSAVSTWSLAVLALAIEFKIKIVISLVISIVVYLSQLVQYPQFLQKSGNICRTILPVQVIRLYDKLADQLSHEDMVFYLKSVANVAEFLTGIFLFVNAVWIFMFESASAIRACGMLIHCYFNIWCEARKGWKIYCQRKTASMKIMSLADATVEQLAARCDDVCAICYEEMESAKVTLCDHLFHSVCLRKWLYVQNTCPLCHQLLYDGSSIDELTRGEGQGQGNAEEDEDLFVAENPELPHLLNNQQPEQQQIPNGSSSSNNNNSNNNNNIILPQITESRSNIPSSSSSISHDASVTNVGSGESSVSLREAENRRNHEIILNNNAPPDNINGNLRNPNRGSGLAVLL